MSEHQTKLTPEEQRRRVKLKWDLLANASTDEAVTAGNFRFMFRVLQQLDLLTWTCTISDDRLCAELPGCRNRKTAEDHRSAIIKAGYWTTDSGSGRHATRYFVAEEIPERASAEIAARKQAFQEERANRPKPNRVGVKQPRKGQSGRGQTAPDTGVISPPVQVSSSSMAPRQEDETQDTHAPAPMPARAVPPPLDDDDWLGDLPHADLAQSDYRLSNSIRCNCGAPANCEIQLIRGGRFEPHCVDCAEECGERNKLVDVRAIPNGLIADRAPISSAQPIAANDSLADYRRARDGS